MTTTYTLAELRQIEQTADNAGIDLMQRAARSCADWVNHHFPVGSEILVAAGTGNNGGDALWAGLNLQSRDYLVTLFIPQPIKSPAALQALALCKANGLPIIDQLSSMTTKPALLIDGLFGIGLDRPLSNNWQIVINALNHLAIPTLALDTPSGLDAYKGITYGTAIKASSTLTFLGDKPALHEGEGAELSGEVLVDMLDLPKNMQPKK